MARSKRYTELASKVDKNRTYSVEEAIQLIKETSTTKFDASVEVHINLTIDPKKGDQQVRGAVSLPHGIGKTKKVAAFVGQDKEKEAKEAGADLVGGESLIEEIKKTGKIDFDVAVATPDMMPKLAVIARVLGPKGLMPSPKNETISPNVKKMVEELKKGKISFKNDDNAIVHQIIGKVSFAENQLAENLKFFIDSLRKAKPNSTKGSYIKSITLASSMGPGVKVEL